jgi:nitroreductase
MDVFDAIKARRSCRRFLPRAVARADIEAVVDAARYAPSANNAQPWEFVVVADQAMREELAAVCEEGAFLGNAPAVVAIFCRACDHALEAGAAACQTLLLAATARGLASCWVAGAGTGGTAAIEKLLGARGNQQSVALVALGYGEEETELRPSRRLLSDVLHWEHL